MTLVASAVPGPVLLPCPFCGDARTSVAVYGDDVAAVCSLCAARGPAYANDADGVAVAVESWNRAARRLVPVAPEPVAPAAPEPEPEGVIALAAIEASKAELGACVTLDRFTYEDEIKLQALAEDWDQDAAADGRDRTIYMGEGWRVMLLGNGDPR